LSNKIWLRCRTSNETYHPEIWTLKHNVQIDPSKILTYSIIDGEREVAKYLSNGEIDDPLELEVEPYACYYVTRCTSNLENGKVIIIDVLEQENSYYIVCTIDPSLRDEITQLGINLDLEAKSKIMEFYDSRDNRKFGVGWFEINPFKDKVKREEVVSFYEAIKIAKENYSRQMEQKKKG